MESNRKPPGMSWESYAEQLIREAQLAGEFDNLPGMGKPIPGLDGYDDADWWVREKLRREQISALPPSLQIKADVCRALEKVWNLSSADAVRREVMVVNDQIRQANFAIHWGPPSTQMPLDVDEVLREWERRRATQ